MTSLKTKIKAHIAATGPITVAEYMSMCLGDPDEGYYITREPFGQEGDFITAPEVSQMFGELIGAVFLGAYEMIGNPKEFQLVEVGPGRGTLMADFLRTASLRPQFLQAARLNLVETSERLRTRQRSALSRVPLTPQFRNRLEEVPKGPLLLVANELLDALPIHQFVKTPQGWQERQVGLSQSGDLMFGVGTAKLPQSMLPSNAETAPEGTILETQPAANALVEEVGNRINADGGAALFIDYGYAKTSPGETLQALFNKQFDDPLAHPGEADLTAHVNFEALTKAVSKSGAVALPLLEQGDFLLKTGLLERAGALGHGKSHTEQDAIRDAVERLAAPDQMGNLFKVLAITNKGVTFPPFN